jgi:hypothetical protein
MVFLPHTRGATGFAPIDCHKDSVWRGLAKGQSGENLLLIAAQNRFRHGRLVFTSGHGSHAKTA